MAMMNISDILETIAMIEEEHLDIRTITMGISLLDCCDSDIKRSCDKIYDKITRRAEKLVATGEQIEKAYYKTDINGYRFVVLCDDGEDTWDHPDMAEEQYQFLDDSLAEAADRGLPMFVICHVPVEGVNGQDIIYPDGGLDDNSEAVQTILEKYENVFFISGHVHTGINGPLVENVFGFSCVETINGVKMYKLQGTYVWNDGSFTEEELSPTGFCCYMTATKESIYFISNLFPYLDKVRSV